MTAQVPAAVDLFVARQPIFTRAMEVDGYELLFRAGPENYYHHDDGTQASAEVIAASLLAIDMDRLTGGLPAYVNFTRELLFEEYYKLLAPESVVVELLEDVEIDDGLVDRCRRLKGDGYRLALDDVTDARRIEPLLDVADVVKVDFRAATAPSRAVIARAVLGRPRPARLLAEKVESPEEFEEACGLGYELFQGYFFSRPVVVSGKEIPAFALNLIELLHAAHRSDFDFGELEGIVKRDVALSYKMLRFANAAAHGVRHRIESVKHALVMLGQQDVTRAVSLLTLVGMGADRPQELAVRSVVRATLCEALAPLAGMADRKLDLFLLGMFSLVDAILEMPMAEIIPRLPTSSEVDEALLGEPGHLRQVLDVATAYEDGDWAKVEEIASDLGVERVRVPPLYVDAVARADDIFSAHAA